MIAPHPPRPRTRAIALTVALVSFMAILEGTVIATALPDMARDFGIAPIDLSVGMTTYLLVSAAMLPASGWVAEHFGVRRVFVVAILGFALASLLCGAANGLPAFVAARALQACFASMMSPVGNLILLRVTPKRDLVSAMTISTTPALIAPVIGPPLGAFITAFAGWRWIFFINLPLALIGTWLILRIIPHLPKGKERRFDGAGFALTASALVALVLGFDRLGAHPHAWGLPVVMILAGAGLGVLAIRHARRTRHPVVPLNAMRHHSFAAMAFGGAFLARLPFLAQAILLPLYFQIGFGLSTIVTGVLLLAQNAGDLAVKAVAGRALKAMGFRRALTWGTLMMIAGFAAYAALSPAMGVVILFVAVFAIGAARSIFFTAMMALTFADVTEEEAAGASVLNSLAFAISAAIGISLGALLINLAPGASPLEGYRTALLILAGIGALSIPLLARLAPDAGAEVSGHRRVAEMH